MFFLVLTYLTSLLKCLKRFAFSCQINLTIGERPNKKNIESLNVTQKETLFLFLSRTVNVKVYGRGPPVGWKSVV